MMFTAEPPEVPQPEPSSAHTVVVAVPEGRAEMAVRQLLERSTKAPDPARLSDGDVSVIVPDRIPAACVYRSAADYSLSPLVFLALLKQESGGRTGLVSPNTNGTFDLGPAQLNTSSWAAFFEKKYNISKADMIHNMCQSIRAMAYAVRYEINGANGDLWRGIGNYHSRTKVHHDKYVKAVYAQYRRMVTTGKF